MAVKIERGGKLMIALIALGLIGYGLWKYGFLDSMLHKVMPKEKEAGVITADDFKQEGQTPTGNQSTPPVAPAVTPTASGPLQRPIRVAIVTWGGYAGGIVANNGFAPNKNCTFYKEFGVQVEMLVIDDFAQSREAFKTGGDKSGVDIMWSTVDAYALEYPSLTNLSPVSFMQYDWSRGGDAIAVSSEIKTIEDLRGKKIAVAEATPSHYFALYVLTQGGLTNQDVVWVFTSSAVDAANTFKAGHVDACVSWSPDVYMAAEARQGAKIMASTREATNLIADIFVARGDFMANYPKELAAFTAGWMKGVEMTNKDPENAIRLMAKSFVGIGLEDARGMLSDVKLPDYWENRSFFEMDGDVPVGYDDIFKTSSGLWRKIGLAAQSYQPYQTRTTNVLAAIESNFPKKAAPKPEFTFEQTPPPASKEGILTKRISIYFASGSAKLDENAKFALEQIAELASTFGNAYMRVSGNTDDTGAHEANLVLSQKRAQAVVDFLVTTYNYDRNKFVVEGNGPDKPISENNSEDGRAKNRRTDFEIIPR